jgi:hypothetical protein
LNKIYSNRETGIHISKGALEDVGCSSIVKKILTNFHALLQIIYKHGKKGEVSISLNMAEEANTV